MGFNIDSAYEVISRRCRPCGNGTLTNVLPHWNHMPKKYDMTFDLSQGRPVVVLSITMELCGTLPWSTQLPILRSWVRPDLESIPRPSKHVTNAQLNDAGVVVVSQRV